MKIYFAASIRGGRDDVELYRKIIRQLRKYGTVLTEHVGDKSLSSLGEDGPSDEYIHDRDMGWIAEADCVVAEVTTPSLGVGYEIRAAVESGKKVLCLYKPMKGRRLSAMIAGCSKVVIKPYGDFSEIIKALDECLMTRFF